MFNLKAKKAVVSYNLMVPNAYRMCGIESNHYEYRSKVYPSIREAKADYDRLIRMQDSGRKFMTTIYVDWKNEKIRVNGFISGVKIEEGV